MANFAMSKYWIHPYKWDGYNSTWLKYLQEAKAVCNTQVHERKHGTEIRKIIERSEKFLTILYNSSCESKAQILANAEFQRLKSAVAVAKRDGTNPPPKPIYRSDDPRHPTFTRQTTGTQADTARPTETQQQTSKKRKKSGKETPQPDQLSAASSLMTSPVVTPVVTPAASARQSFASNATEIHTITMGNNWIPEYNLRVVAQWLQNFLEASTEGEAYQCVTRLHDRDRNGFVSLDALADSFGRSQGELSMTHQQFQWGIDTLPTEWNAYKALIDGTGFLTQNPAFEQQVAQMARRGFKCYHNHQRLTDYIRTHVPIRDCKWDKLRTVVDTFIGDTLRQHYSDFCFENPQRAVPMDTSGVFTNEEINAVMKTTNSRLFKALPKKGAGPQQNDQYNKGAPQTKPKNSNSNAPKAKPNYGNNQAKQTGNGNNNGNKGNNGQPKQKPKKQKGPPVTCGWCGDSSHFSHKCTKKNDPKWKSHTCTNCKGKGHPASVCVSPKSN